MPLILLPLACSTVERDKNAATPTENGATAEAKIDTDKLSPEEKVEYLRTQNEKEGTKVEQKMAGEKSVNPGDPTAASTPVADEAVMPPKALLVLRFHNRSPYGGKEIITTLQKMLKEQVSKMREYKWVDESELPGSEEFVQFEEYYFPAIFEKARSTGIAGIMLGSIEDVYFQEKGDEMGLFGSRYHKATATLRFQLFDVGTEKEIYSHTSTGEVDEEFTQFMGSRSEEAFQTERAKMAIMKAAQSTLAALPLYAKRLAWEGQIAKVDLHRYYINAGESSGISKGQLLSVFSEGKVVIDPQTKQAMGFAKGQYKGMLKVIDFIGQDAAVAIVYQGSQFQQNDRVYFVIHGKLY